MLYKKSLRNFVRLIKEQLIGKEVVLTISNDHKINIEFTKLYNREGLRLIGRTSTEPKSMYDDYDLVFSCNLKTYSKVWKIVFKEEETKLFFFTEINSERLDYNRCDVIMIAVVYSNSYEIEVRGVEVSYNI